MKCTCQDTSPYSVQRGLYGELINKPLKQPVCFPWYVSANYSQGCGRMADNEATSLVTCSCNCTDTIVTGLSDLFDPLASQSESEKPVIKARGLKGFVMSDKDVFPS